MAIKKLGAIFTTMVIILTALFTGSYSVTAETKQLSGRNDFALGVNIHPSHMYAAYANSYNTILDAKATGAKFVRTGYDSDEYTLGFVDLAAKHGLGVMMYVSFTYYNNSENRPLRPDEIDVEAIYNSMYEKATVLRGKVKYYQINNEMCIPMLKGGNGFYASQFKDCSGIAVGLYASVKAIKAADPEAQIVVNFSWEHIGIIDAIKDVKLDADTGLLATENTENVTHAAWDLIGMDWYSNGRNKDFTTPEGVPIDYQYIIETLNGRHPEMDVIVCEANLWPKSENSDGTISYYEDSTWLENYIRYCYSNPKVKGFFVYELYDEPAYSKDSNGNYIFNKESHFGILDKNGNKKEVYETIRAVYGGTGILADRTIPNAPTVKNEGEFKSLLFSNGSTGLTGTIPTVYSDRKLFTLNNSIETDYSGANFIEFDFYVEDGSAFKTAFDRNNLKFRIEVTCTNGARRWSKYVTAEDILKDGWNHVTVPISAFVDRTDGFDWSKVKSFNFGFAADMGKSSNYSELTGMKVAINNICFTNIAPDNNEPDETELLIDKDGISNVAERYYQWYLLNNRKTISAKNISNFERIEFDFYVENLTTFRSLISENDHYLYLYSSSNYTNFYGYKISNYVTKQGWNRINIKISDFDVKGGTFNPANLVAYGMAFAENIDSSGNNIPNPFAASYISLCNFIATNSEPELPQEPEIPESSTLPYVEVFNEEMEYTWGAYYHYTQDKFYRQLSSPVDLYGCNTLEFDIYVNSVNDFQNMTSGSSQPLYFILGTDSNRHKARARYIFSEQVTKNGWNHIVLDLNNYSYGGGDTKPNFGTVQHVFLSFWSENIKNPFGDQKAKISNVYGSFIPDDVMPVKNDFFEKGLNKINLDKEGNFVKEVEIDMSNSKMIELDLFLPRVSSHVISIMLVDGNENFAFYEFTGLIVGWNHLAARRDSYSYMADLDFSNIKSVWLMSAANSEIYVSNFYCADYLDYDVTRDGKLDLKDVVRAKKLAVGITDKGNKLAICEADDIIDGKDLTAVSENVIKNIFS